MGQHFLAKLQKTKNAPPPWGKVVSANLSLYQAGIISEL
jgi:hypothetical protein